MVDTSLPYASVVEEYSGTTLANGTLAARYDYGDDLIRMDWGPVGSQVASYYLYDGLGSTRQLVSAAGAVTDTWGYTAFGEQAGRTGSTVNAFLFNAQQFDQPTGTYFLRARYYDQTAGRFLSQDPFSGSDEDPISLHRYLYAGDDAVNFVDPGGQDLTEAVIVVGVAAVLVGITGCSNQSASTRGLNTARAVYGSHGPSGNKFWEAYSQVDYQKFPTAADRPQVAAIVGGNVGEYISDKENCATRLSYALGQAGWKIHANNEFQTNLNSISSNYMGKPGDGNRYIFGAKNMRRYLHQAWGEPDFANYHTAGRDPNSAEFLDPLSLGSDGVAVFATDGHVGVIRSGYRDPYIHDQGVADVWKLKQ